MNVQTVLFYIVLMIIVAVIGIFLFNEFKGIMDTSVNQTSNIENGKTIEDRIRGASLADASPAINIDSAILYWHGA